MRDDRFYLAFYPAAFICLCLIWLMPCLEHSRVAAADDAAWLETLPVWSYDQIKAEVEAVDAELKGPAHDDPFDYYRVVFRYHRLNNIAARYLKTHPDPVLEFKIDSGLWMTIPGLQQRYAERFGWDRLAQLSKDNTSAIERNAPMMHPTFVSYDSFWASMAKAYVYAIILAIPFFLVRVDQKGMSVLLDLWRIAAAIVIWPVGLFVYPTRVDPRKQLQRAHQFVRWALTGLLWLAPCVAGAQQDGKTSGRRSAPIAQIEEAQHPAVLLTGWTALHSQGLTKNDVVTHSGPVMEGELTATFRNGVFLDGWAQTGTDFAKDFGREVDGTVGWDSTYVHAGVSYFDLYPNFKKTGAGDVVRPYVELDYPIEIDEHHTLTPYIRGEELWATHNSSHNSAPFSFVGLRHRWKINDTLTFDQRTWALYDDGLFGGNRGMIGRYEAALYIKVSDGFTVMPFDFKLSVPFAGIHDGRQVEAVGGIGASFSLPLQ